MRWMEIWTVRPLSGTVQTWCWDLWGSWGFGARVGEILRFRAIGGVGDTSKRGWMIALQLSEDPKFYCRKCSWLHKDGYRVSHYKLPNRNSFLA